MNIGVFKAFTFRFCMSLEGALYHNAAIIVRFSVELKYRWILTHEKGQFYIFLDDRK